MAVTIFEALSLIDQHTPTLSTEIVPIENALQRVAAQTLHARLSLPTFNNSAMDGYGLKGESQHYKIIGKILAGDSHSYELEEGECIKILTGAKVPPSIERIIPQEHTKESQERIAIQKEVPLGANIRHKGEDILEGESVVETGESINAAHIALLASQGITHIEVYKKVHVAVFASGSELKLHFEPLQEAQIYNSNTNYLLARSQELGATTRFVGKSEDSPKALKKLIESALDCDLIVTSGGVSVGEADFTKEAFGALGMEFLFQKVAIKPGKPTTFGKIGKTLILNLPGNPLASSLNFELFGSFLLHKLSGKRAYYPNTLYTPLKGKLHSPRPVAQIIPGSFNGQYFQAAAKFAPGMVNVLSHCNSMIVIDEKREKIEEGEIVKVLPLRWDFLAKSFTKFTS